MKSRREVYWDLSESDIIKETDGYRFYFSSEFKLSLYDKYYKRDVIDALNKASVLWPALKHIDYSTLKAAFAYQLYRKTEKRGCRFEYIGGENGTT